MSRRYLRPSWNPVLARCASAVLLLLALRSTRLLAQPGMYTPAERAAVKAVPLSLDLSRRVYGVTNDIFRLVKTDPVFKRALFSGFGQPMTGVITTLEQQPRFVAVVRAAHFQSVRDYELASMAFVTAYSVANAYPGEDLDLDRVTTPAQVNFIRAHKTELAALMVDRPLMVNHTAKEP